MPTLVANLSAAVALAVLSAIVPSAALAQGTYRSADFPQQRVPQGLAGAGGSGGAGGGAESRRGAVVNEAERDSPCVTRARLSQAPALDPSRKIYAIDCTKPFDALGKGNLCCI